MEQQTTIMRTLLNILFLALVIGTLILLVVGLAGIQIPSDVTEPYVGAWMIAVLYLVLGKPYSGTLRNTEERITSHTTLDMQGMTEEEIIADDQPHFHFTHFSL